MRLELKMAIYRTGRSQRSVSALSGIAEPRLSGIVRGWVEPTDDERRRLMDILGAGPEVFARDEQHLAAAG